MPSAELVRVKFGVVLGRHSLALASVRLLHSRNPSEPSLRYPYREDKGMHDFIKPRMFGIRIRRHGRWLGNACARTLKAIRRDGTCALAFRIAERVRHLRAVVIKV